MILRLDEIERKVWEEEKTFLMKQVGILLIKNNAVKFGDYILASGKKSPYYVDLRQTISSPITMDWIANSLTRIVLNEIGRDKIDRILGVPTAGIPFATVVSQKLGIPLIYYRQARKEHGVRKKIEGILERNDRVLVIDFFASRRCGVTIGDLTADFRARPPGAGYVELAPIEGIRLFAESRLLPTLRSADPWLHLGGPVFARHLALRLDRPEAWIDFLDEPSTLARRPTATGHADEATGAGQ